MRRCLFVALAIAGCSNDFDPASYLEPGALRALAIIAEPAEVAPNGTTTLTLVTPEPSGMPTYEWTVCTQPPPPGSSSVDPLCLEADMGAFLEPVAGSGPSAMVTMPADAGPMTLGVPDATGGLYVPVRVRATLDGQRLDMIYGLRLSLPGLEPTNHNPTIASVSLVAEPLDASPMSVVELSADPTSPTPVAAGSEPTLRVTLTPDSFEVYPQLGGTPPHTTITMTTEEPRFSWYADAGLFSEDVTGAAQPDTQLKLDDVKHHPARAGDRINLFVVVRDERGGTASAHRYLVAQ